jgi:hypothetical protein
MQTPVDAPLFLPMYLEPPLRKWKATRGPSTQSSNSVESHGPSPRASSASLSVSSWKLSVVFTIELPTKTPRASFPPIHGDSHTTNLVGVVSQDSRPHSIQLQRLMQEPRDFYGFFLTSLNILGIT